MTAPIEIRYAGVPIGQPAPARQWDNDGFFFSFPDPLPVGTVVDVVTGGQAARGRVIRVLESSDRGACGMRIALIEQTVAQFFGHAAADAPSISDGVPVMRADRLEDEEPVSAAVSVSSDSSVTVDSSVGSDSSVSNDSSEEKTPAPVAGGKSDRRRKRRR